MKPVHQHLLDSCFIFLDTTSRILHDFVFQFQTDDDKYPSMSQAQLKLSTVAYSSVNHRYLYISLPTYSSDFVVDDYANINIIFYYRDYLSLKTFSYQVKDCQRSNIH